MVQEVQLDVQINEWFGGFYNLIQKCHTKPNTVELPDYFIQLFSFLKIAAVLIIVAVFVDFYRYVFRWRTATFEYYTDNWHKLRHIEELLKITKNAMRLQKLWKTLGLNLFVPY